MERLQKVIASTGAASRRKAEELILEGRVKVNGIKVTELGVKVSQKDQIQIDGEDLVLERKVYFVLNKPAGVVSTSNDEHNRKTVVDFFGDVAERIYPVGRLDYDTTGVLILTNDGDFTNKLIHPSSQLEKEYIARVEGVPSKEKLDTLAKGIILDGHKTKRARLKIESVDRKNNSSSVSIVLTEGKYHQVKRMFEAIGHPVKKLTRTRFGCIEIEDLPKGMYRPLKIHEVKTLLELSSKRPEYRKLDIRNMRKI